ncbi:reverse transcriptase domain-containing protein [Tanacetum coccineum]
MRTRSQSRNQNRPQQQAPPVVVEPFNLEEPIDNPPVVNMAANGAGGAGPPPAGGGGLPVPDLRTMEELCQPSLDGRGGPIAPIAIQATTFGLKNDMIQQVQNSCPFRGPGDDANKHLDKFLHVTQSMKVNGVSDDALRLHLFPYSLQDRAAEWFDRLPRNSINSFDQMAKIFLGKYFPPSMVTKLRNDITNFRQRPDESLFEAWERYKLSIDRCPNHNMLPVTQIDTFYNGLTLRHRDTINAAAGGTFMKRRPEECYDLIENMTAHHNDWDTSAQRNESSSSITSSNPEIASLKLQMEEMNRNLTRVLQTNQQVNTVTPSCETCGGPHSYNDCPATVGQNQNVYAVGAYNQGGNSYQPQELTNYIRINENKINSMQTQMNNLATSNQRLESMLGNFIKMNTASSSGTGSLPSNTVANPKGELKAITTRSGLVLDEPSVPMPPPFINLEEDERVEETFTDPEHGEFTIKVPPPLVQKAKQRNFVIHQRDPRHPNIPYPSRMNQEKQKEKDEVQIHKFWQMFKQLHINITLSDALILIPKYQKMLKILLSNKEKLIELANTPVMSSSAKPGASINLMLLSMWKELGLPELISTQMTLELANRDICTPKGIARDVFVPVGKFTFPANFVIVDYESDPLNNDIFDPEEDIIENLLNLDKTIDLPPYHDNKLSGNPTPILEPETKSSSSSPTLISLEESDLIWEEFKAYLARDSFPPGNSNPSSLLPPFHNSLSGSTTSSSPSLHLSETSDYFLEEFTDELALITFPPGNDDLSFDAESDLRELEYFLNHDPIKDMDSILEDSVNENSLDENLVDTISEMFTNEHALDYSSPPLWDDYDDNLVDHETVNDDTYDDPFDFKEEKIKDSKILINELDLPESSNFLPFPGGDSGFLEDFSVVALCSSTTTRTRPLNASLSVDFNPLFELPFHKRCSRARSFSLVFIRNVEKVGHPDLGCSVFTSDPLGQVMYGDLGQDK